MLAALKAGNLLVTAAFMLVGTGALAVMTYPLWPTPRPRSVMAAAIDQRWLPPEPPPLPKADRLAPAPQLAAADPLGPPVRLQPPPTSPGGPVEQALERKAEDAAGERAAREYHRATRRRDLEEEDRPRDVCARHGLRKVYVHNHRNWRCR